MQVSTTLTFAAEAAFKGALIFVAAYGAARLLRRKSAATRHVVWSAAFAGVLLLPIFSLLLPALSLPATGLALSDFLFRTTAHASAGQHTVHSYLAAPLTPGTNWPNWQTTLLLIWVGGVAVHFSRMLAGWLFIRRLAQRARKFRVSFIEVSGRVDILEIEAGRMPMAIGVLQPRILIPADALEWSAERRRMVLLHELAHVRRRDVATHLMARLALSLHWWNPAAWLAWREFLKERESAADDWVLSRGECGPGYARELLEMARSLQAPAVIGHPAVAMASASDLNGRLQAILDPTRNRDVPGGVFLWLVAISVIGLVAPLAATQSSGNAGLLHLGDDAREHQQFDRAKTIYTKALVTSGNRSDAATALIHRGTIELATKDFVAALHDFQEASVEDERKTGEARMWLAITEQYQGNLPAADSWYRRALAAMDPHAAEAAIVRDLRAQLLEQQGETEEAAKLRGQAAEIRNAQAARALANPGQSSDARKVGGDVRSPVLESKVEPQYSEEARIAHYSGMALLKVEVGTDGQTHNIQVVRPLGLGLDEKAVEAVAKWRFQPGKKDGQPVKVSATIEVNFKLI